MPPPAVQHMQHFAAPVRQETVVMRLPFASVVAAAVAAVWLVPPLCHWAHLGVLHRPRPLHLLPMWLRRPQPPVLDSVSEKVAARGEEDTEGERRLVMS